MNAADREDALSRLLGRTGFAHAQRFPLAGDASTRRYERLFCDDRRAILMDAPRANESPPCPPDATEAERRALGWNAVSRLAASRVEAFAAVADHLKTLGLSAPAILGVDVEAGFGLVEDLGDALFAQAIPAGADEIELYAAAGEALALAHRDPPPAQLPAPDSPDWPLLDYDRLALTANADLFLEWLPQAEPGAQVSEAAVQLWERARDALVEEALTFPRAFTIRDFHAENLIWLPERTGAQRVGLLDFQDAVRGWRAWDFSMLLHDARRDVSPAAGEAALGRYFALTGAPEAPFRRELAVLGALNTLRIIGIFSRLIARDAKPRYRAFLPREWGHLNALFAHPALAEMGALVRGIAGPALRAAA